MIIFPLAEEVSSKLSKSDKFERQISESRNNFNGLLKLTASLQFDFGIRENRSSQVSNCEAQFRFFPGVSSS